jgi:thiol-disulfide isomerase/thioredoxin
MDFAAKFAAGLPYREFLDKYGSDEHRRRWAEFHGQVRLSDAQKELLRSFKREMQVIVLAGTWCGDCVNQCPILDHFAAETDKIQIRYVDRDADPELTAELSVCGGHRVPAVVFLNEEGQHCGRYGDRTLAKYRQIAGDQFGSACPTGLIAPAMSLTESVVQDWLDEFERIQLLLRTSPRLRQKHGD